MKIDAKKFIYDNISILRAEVPEKIKKEIDAQKIKKEVDEFIQDNVSTLRAEIPEDIKREIDIQRIVKEANKDKNKDGHSSDKMMPIINKRKLHNK